MNKTAIAAVAAMGLLASAFAGGAVFSGRQVKTALLAAPRAWQAQFPLLKITEQRYERGLFSSIHTMTVQLGCSGLSNSASGPAALTFKQHVQHGPFPGFAGIGAATIDTELVLSDAARQQLEQFIGQRPPFTAHTVVDFNGASRTRFAIPAFKAPAVDGRQIAFQGMTGEVHDSGRSLQYDVSVPGLSMNLRDPRMAMDMTVAGAHVRGELLGTGSLWTRAGTGEGELATFDVNMAPLLQAAPAVRFGLSQLKFTSTNTVDKDLLTAVARLSGRGVVSDVKLDKFDMQASFKRLHLPSYERFLQRVMDTSAAACDMKQAVSPQVMLSQMQEDLAALLPYNPEYALDRLTIESGGQSGELSYAFGFNAVTADDAKLPMQALLLSKGQVRGRASMPAMWVEKIAERISNTPAEMTDVMIAKMADDGWIVRKGAMLSAEFSFEAGQLLVNGKPATPPTAR